MEFLAAAVTWALMLQRCLYQPSGLRRGGLLRAALQLLKSTRVPCNPKPLIWPGTPFLHLGGGGCRHVVRFGPGSPRCLVGNRIEMYKTMQGMDKRGAGAVLFPLSQHQTERHALKLRVRMIRTEKRKYSF